MLPTTAFGYKIMNDMACEEKQTKTTETMATGGKRRHTGQQQNREASKRIATKWEKFCRLVISSANSPEAANSILQVGDCA